MCNVVCGLDFGTSNTTIATADRAGMVRLVPVEGAREIIPSTIFFPANASVLCGRAATAAYIAGDDGRYMRSLKRLLGTSLMKDGTIINGRKADFRHIIARYIRAIKTTAEAHAGAALTDVVAGRPVHFIEDDSAADMEAETQLREILQDAGFKHIRFQYEPIAAAFAHEVKLDQREQLAMVIDIGGGTSDFTLIRLSGRYTAKLDRQDDILANAGARLGGNDFDRALAWDNFMPDLGMGSTWGTKNLPFPTAPFADLAEWSKIQWMYTPLYKRHINMLTEESHDKVHVSRLLTIVEHELGHRFMAGVEDAKIALSTEVSATTDLAFITPDFTVTSTRQQFEQGLGKAISKIENTITECLAQAGVVGASVDLAVLTGGGTSIPALQDLVKRLLPSAALSQENNLSSVGLGLAYDARRHFLKG